MKKMVKINYGNEAMKNMARVQPISDVIKVREICEKQIKDHKERIKINKKQIVIINNEIKKRGVLAKS